MSDAALKLKLQSYSSQHQGGEAPEPRTLRWSACHIAGSEIGVGKPAEMRAMIAAQQTQHHVVAAPQWMCVECLS